MMAQTSGRQRVMAGITHGDGSGFARFLKKGYFEVDTRRTQQTATRTDYDVIINVVTARVPNDKDTDCATGIEDWTGVRYADYTPISSFNRGQVLVEKGLEIGNQARGGQEIILRPGVDTFKEYVVAGCTVGTDQGSYMGLEANHPPSNSGYVGYTKDHFTAFPRQDQNAHSFPPMASLLMLTDKSVDGKKVKMVSWSAGNNNDFANVGVASVTAVGGNGGIFEIVWAQPFADANYVVVGLANMWCSGGFGLHIDDDFTQTKLKTRVTTTHPYDQYQINHYGGDCTFQTLFAIGN